MQVAEVRVTQDQARVALAEYKSHRDIYDKKDWEIERIYRQIAKGNKVISAFDSIRNAGSDSQGRPKLAICEAHAYECRADKNGDVVSFGVFDRSRTWTATGKVSFPWPGAKHFWGCAAKLPRIPPQHRPAAGTLHNYHILWEADWQDLPRDPILLRRIGKDAWVVLAAWDLTDVEMMVLRSRERTA